jgi:hypothetical protein
MKTFTTILVSCFLSFTSTSLLLAQCPAVLSLNVVSVSHATCPVNGAVTLGGSGVAAYPLPVYKIIAGPSRVGTQQSSNVFTSLSAGVYTFRAVCGVDTVYTTATVNNNYTPINPNFTVSVTNVCTSYSRGGTITVTGVSGGRGSLKYSFIKNINASYSDALSVYGTSNTFTATTWGTYQVRIKDACNQFVTKTVQLDPLYPSVSMFDALTYFDYMPCDSAYVTFSMIRTDGQYAVIKDFPSLKMNIYEKSGSSGCVKGTFIKTVNYLSTSMNDFTIPKRNLVVDIITPCGDTGTSCYYYPVVDSMVSIWKPLITGCGTIPNPTVFSLQHSSSQYAHLPITYQLYNNTVDTLMAVNTSYLATDHPTFSNLPMTGDNFRIVATDACGNKDTVYYSVPPIIAPSIAPMGLGTFVDRDCSYVTGRLTVGLTILGYVPNLFTSTVTITSGPDHIGTAGILRVSDSKFFFYDLTPGATYNFDLDNGCTIIPLSFTIPNSVVPLSFSINPMVDQQCGGTGNINANLLTNAYSYSRTELWQSGFKIDNNNAGVYTNLPAGTYEVRGIIEKNSCLGTKAATITDNVTVQAAGAPPVVQNQYAYVCQTGLGKGSASINLTGARPFTYEIKQLSPITAAGYTVIAVNDSAFSRTFSGLDSGAVYDLRIIDKCGITGGTELSINNIGSIPLETIFNPCLGDPYSLDVQYIPGATYSWEKNNASGVVLSTTNSYVFTPPYVSAYDGRYICTISLDNGCVQRQVAATITGQSGALCPSVLPVTLHAFTVTANNCKEEIAFTASAFFEGNYIVERSNDGIMFKPIAAIKSVTNQLTYQFTDNSASSGINYYRIKMINNHGKYAYSIAKEIDNKCVAGLPTTGVGLYPNPVVNDKATLSIAADRSGVIRIDIINTVGQSVNTQTVYLTKGHNTQAISTTHLAKGAYLVKVTDGNRVLGTVKMLKQ